MARKRKSSPTSDDDDDDFVLEDNEVLVVVDDDDDDDESDDNNKDDGEFQMGNEVFLEEDEDDLMSQKENDSEEEGDDDDDFKPAKKKSKTESTKKSTTTKKTTKKTTKTTKDDATTKKKKESKTKKTDTASKKKGSVVGGKRTIAKPDTIKSEPEARKVILQYMEQQNRPYNVQNVMDNLQGRVKKAMTTKVLDKLVEDGQLSCKENGKAKVYMLNQGEQDVLDADQLKQMETSIVQLTQKRNTLKEEVKILQAEKDRYSKTLTHEQIKEQISELRQLIETKNTKLSQLNENKDSLASPEEKAKALQNMERFRKLWRGRKRITKDILDQLCEGLNKKTSALKKELDIEEDPIDINTMGTL